MIAFLRGVLVERTGGEIVIDVGGVGYRVTVAPTTNATLGELGAEVFVHIHHHFREDDQTLYGFAARDERVCFQALISAHGVGPALGLAILGVHDPGALAHVLATEDVAALCLVPGVGKKTAARLLVELKEKLDVGTYEGAAPNSAGVLRRRHRRWPTSAKPSTGWATGRTRSPPPCASCPTRVTAPSC